MKKRPSFIKHYLEIENKEPSSYPNSNETLSLSSSFGRFFGLKRLGIHHETLPPKSRTSYPHAESSEEEFFFVIEGHPDVWIDGELHRLNPGDGVGFVPGTGICHTVINNTQQSVRLLVVGDTQRKDNLVAYPLNLNRQKEVGDKAWLNAPIHLKSNHPGTPD